MPALSVSGVKDHSVSDDRKQFTITFTTKYVGDLDLTMPTACLDGLLSALKLASSAIQPAVTQPATIQPAATQPSDAESANRLKVTMPKTWLVTADVKERGVVVVAFNHQSEMRTGYALDPDAAKKIANGLNRNADAILEHKKSVSSPIKE